MSNKLSKLKNLQRILQDVKAGRASQKDLAMLETMENQSDILAQVLEETKKSANSGGAEMVSVKGNKVHIKGIKGDDGYTPQKGKDYFTSQEINKIVNEVFGMVRTPVDGNTPIKGRDYFTKGEIKAVVNEVISLIPIPKDGVSPDTNEIIQQVINRLPNENRIVEKVLKRIPKPKDGKDGRVPIFGKDFLIPAPVVIHESSGLEYVKSDGVVIRQGVETLNFEGFTLTREGNGVKISGGGGRGDLTKAQADTYYKPIDYTPDLSAYALTTDLAGLYSVFVPYTGATGDVNLGNHSLTATKLLITGGLTSGFLKANGDVDSSTYLTTVTAHNLLSATHGDTTTGTVARGSIIYGNATPKWATLAFPASPTGKVLQATATDVAWSTSALGTGAFAAAGATLALNNLASVAINTSLISDTDNTDDLGSLAKSWNNTYTNKVFTTAIVPHADSTTAFGIFKANGTTNVLNVDTTNGRVGIGITPLKTFTIAGEDNDYQLLITNASGWYYEKSVGITFGDTSGGSSLLVPFSSNAIWTTYYGIAFKTGATAHYNLAAGTGGTDDVGIGGNINTSNLAGAIMVVKSTGYVGIVNTAPAAPLSFAVATGDKIHLYDGGATVRYGMGIQTYETQFYVPSDSHFSFNKGGDLQTSGTNELMRISAVTGYVGIGTITPTSKLQVVGLPTYATNALAITGGLTAGAFYILTGTNAVQVVQ